MSILSVDTIQPIGSGTSVTVNSAATLVLNNANSTGVITATSFSGSGANLTGVLKNIVEDTSPQLGGNLDCNNFVVTLNDSTGSGNNRFKIGNAGDLQIFHLSDANYVSGEVDGKDLYVRSRRDLHLVCGNNASGYRNVIYADNNGTARLYHPASNAVRLQTTTAGVQVTGALNVTTTMHIPDDSNGLQLGDSNDLRVRHDGNNSIISHSGTGDLLINTAAGEKIYIDSSEVIIRNAASNETMIQATENGAVDLFYDNVSKAKTASHGMYFNEAYQHQYVNSGNTIELRFTTNGVRRGSVYADNGNTVGFLHPSGGWSARWHSNGKQTSHGDIWPNANNTYDLGDNSYRWANIWVNDLQLSNEAKKDTGGNDVDGTWGDWTLQEGEDKIYMINNRNGKKYSLKMEEE